MLNKFLKVLRSYFYGTQTDLDVSKNDSVHSKRQPLASITYAVYPESPSVMIDISLDDYDTNSTQALCKILDILSEDVSYTETVNMLKIALIEDKQEDLLLKIFTHISNNARLKIINPSSRKKNEPCIKPSDMLR